MRGSMAKDEGAAVEIGQLLLNWLMEWNGGGC